MIFIKVWKSTTGNYAFLSDDPRYHWQGNPYYVQPNDLDMIKLIDTYLLAHPDALQPEPLPPPPTDAQLEAVAESQRQALFREYDTAIMRLKRAERLGDLSATASIAQWDAYAVALQEINDAPGWFRDTVWPTKPEV